LVCRIVGKAPFRGKSIEEVILENKKGEINFDIPELKKASDESFNKKNRN